MKFKLMLALFLAAAPVLLQAQRDIKLKPNELPTPHFGPISKPDLQVTSIRLVSFSITPGTKLAEIHVSATVVNRGQQTAGATQIKAFIQNIGRSENPWLTFGDPVPVPAITGGQSLTTEFVFHESPRVISTSSVNLKLAVDPANSVVESSETNNVSPSIVVTHQY